MEADKESWENEELAETNERAVCLLLHVNKNQYLDMNNYELKKLIIFVESHPMTIDLEGLNLRRKFIRIE